MVLFCAAVVLFLTIAVQKTIDREFLSSEQSVKELLYFPSAQAVKLFAGGNEMMIADYLWMRMIQYYAYHMRSDRRYEYLYPITDRLTDLDPKFMYPYTFGALLLVHDASDSVNSMRLLDKAKKMNPDKWEFPYMKGFILYIFLKQNDEAIREFLEASNLPNAWDGALRFAAWISKKQGQRKTSKLMWQQLYDKSSSKNERDVAQYYLDKITIEEEIDRLQSLAEKYRQLHGKWPKNLSELVVVGLTKSIVLDKFGRSYYWNETDCQVHNGTHDRYLRMIGKME